MTPRPGAMVRWCRTRGGTHTTVRGQVWHADDRPTVWVIAEGERRPVLIAARAAARGEHGPDCPAFTEVTEPERGQAPTTTAAPAERS